MTIRGAPSKDTVFSTWCTSALTVTVRVLTLNKKLAGNKGAVFSFLYSIPSLPDWLFSGQPFVVFCAYILMFHLWREMAAVLIIDLLWSAQQQTKSNFSWHQLATRLSIYFCKVEKQLPLVVAPLWCKKQENQVLYELKTYLIILTHIIS